MQEQEYDIAPPVGDPIDKLYNTLKSKGYYTKSLEDFKHQYSTPESIDKIFGVVSRDSLYTKSKDDFYNQYFQEFKKKDVPSNTGGEVGTSVHQSQENDDPIKAGLEPIRTHYQEKAEKFNLLNQNEKYHSEQQGLRPPLTSNLAEANKQRQTPSEFTSAKQEHKQATNDLAVANTIVRNTKFQNGAAAKKHLEEKIAKVGGINPNNETDQLAIEKSKEYDNLLNNITENKSITAAAISDRIKNDESFAKQYEALKKDGLNLSNAVEGDIVARYLYQNNSNLQALSKEHPEIKSQYDDLKDNLLKKYPDHGIAVVANEISRKREKLGYNNTVGNFHTDAFDKHNDEIAKTLSPDEQQIWNANKDAITKQIDTGGMLNRFEESIEGGWGNTKNLFKRVTGQNTKGERISEELDKEAKGVSSGETGWKKSFGTASNFAGTIAYMVAGGNLGAGVVNPMIADATVNVGTFGEDFMRQGEMKYPDNTAKALASGITNTLAFAALSPFKSLKVGDALGKVAPEIESAIESLPADATAKTFKETVSDAFAKGAKQYGTGILEMGGLTLFNQGLDKVLGLNQQAFDKYHPSGEIGDVVKNMAIGTLLPSALVTAGGIMKQPTTAKPIESEIPQAEKVFNEKLSVEQKYSKIETEDIFTGEKKEMSVKSAIRTMEKKHDLLEKLVKCLT